MVELEEQATQASRHIIERPRLTRLLDETTARVIMLIAPAGYGKIAISPAPAAAWPASGSPPVHTYGLKPVPPLRMLRGSFGSSERRSCLSVNPAMAAF